MHYRSLIPLAALIAAFWPVWSWISVRALDDSGDAWELLSLITAVLFLASTPMKTQDERQCAPASVRPRRAGAKFAESHGNERAVTDGIVTALPMVILLVYAAAYPFFPPLLCACIAMTAIAAVCSESWFGKRMEFSLLGLLLLALPVIASLNFYLGYPLRVVIGTAAQALLQMNGFAVIREGTLLNWNGQLVSIDAPCSGVKMLWAGLYLSFTLAAFFQLNARNTALLGAVAIAVVLLANVMRTTALFFVEAKVMDVGAAWHTGIGTMVFVFAALAVAAAAHRLKVTPYAA